MHFAVASSEPELDFRSPTDDAWYGVRLSLRGSTLFVHYSDLAEAGVDYFRAADFGSLAAVGEFRDRFRPVSTQLQDRDCRRVVEAGAVCACDCFGENDVRFYDADVEMACFRAHQMFDGSEEVCKCGFLVVWRHGPNRGRKTWTCIEKICLMQDGHVLASATLHDFLRLAVKKIECNNGGLEDKGIKDMTGTQQIKDSVQEIIGNDSIGCRKLPDDVDMGGGYLDSKILKRPKTYSFIVVDNLEKGKFREVPQDLQGH